MPAPHSAPWRRTTPSRQLAEKLCPACEPFSTPSIYFRPSNLLEPPQLAFFWRLTESEAGSATAHHLIRTHSCDSPTYLASQLISLIAGSDISSAVARRLASWAFAFRLGHAWRAIATFWHRIGIGMAWGRCLSLCTRQRGTQARHSSSLPIPPSFAVACSDLDPERGDEQPNSGMRSRFSACSRRKK